MPHDQAIELARDALSNYWHESTMCFEGPSAASASHRASSEARGEVCVFIPVNSSVAIAHLVQASA